MGRMPEFYNLMIAMLCPVFLISALMLMVHKNITPFDANHLVSMVSVFLNSTFSREKL
jgi:hypothetical protein